MVIPSEFYFEAFMFVNEVLQLPPYKIQLNASSSKVFESTGELHNGSVHLDHAYKRGEVNFALEMDSLRDAFSTVVHEALHIKMAPLDSFFQTTALMIKDKNLPVLQKLYTEADEQVVVGLERTLTPMLWEGFCEAYDLDETGIPRASDMDEPEGEPFTA